MGKNTRTFLDDYKNAKASKSLKKPKDIDYNSKMGYSDGSPFSNKPFMDINTPSGYIDMSNTGIPLFANGQYLPPYSGQHFMGTDKVREIKAAMYGGDPSLPGITGHYPFGGQYTKTHTHMKTGGWLDSYDVGGGTEKPLAGPPESKSKAQAYRESISKNVLPYLESVGYKTPHVPGKTIDDIGREMNCIHGICQIVEKSGAKKFGQEYFGNMVFDDNMRKEGFYQADPTNEGFEIGDYLRFSRTKDNAKTLGRYKGKVTPLNKNEFVPQHTSLIIGKRKDEDGNNWYTIANNHGEEDVEVKEFPESELIEWSQKGKGEGLTKMDKMFVSRYDPDKLQEQEKERQQDLAVLRGNNPYANLYTDEGPSIKIKGRETYDLKSGNPIYTAYPDADELYKYYSKNYKKLGKSANLPPEILDQLFVKQVGIKQKESSTGPRSIAKSLIPEGAISTARKVADTFGMNAEDNWIQDYWDKNANNVKDKYRSIEHFVEELYKDRKLDKEAREYLKYNSPASKGAFQQKELSKRGRFHKTGFDDLENQFLSSINLAIDNYHLLEKKYPDLLPQELVELTTLMHNSPSKALTPEYVDYYLKNKNIGYVNDVNAELPAYEKVTPKKQAEDFKKPRTISDTEKKDLMKFLKTLPSKKHGGDLPKAQNGKIGATGFNPDAEFRKYPIRLTDRDYWKGRERDLFNQLRMGDWDDKTVGLNAGMGWGQHNGLFDAWRHASAAANTTKNLLPKALNVFPLNAIAGNLAGYFHEKSGHGQNPSNEFKSDLYNNFVGSMLGALPLPDAATKALVNTAARKGWLSDLGDQHVIIPDVVRQSGPFNQKYTTGTWLPEVDITAEAPRRKILMPGPGPVKKAMGGWLDGLPKAQGTEPTSIIKNEKDIPLVKGYELPEATITDKAPEWMKEKEAYVNKQVEDYLGRNKGLNQLFGLSKENFPEQVKANFANKYMYDRNTKLIEDIARQKGIDVSDRKALLENLSEEDRKKLANSAYEGLVQPSYFNRSLAGASEIASQALSPFMKTFVPGIDQFRLPIPGMTDKEIRDIRDEKILGIPSGGLNALTFMDIPGQAIANYAKNRGVLTGSNYRQLPGMGQSSANVTDLDAAALNPFNYTFATDIPQIVSGIRKAPQAIKNLKNKPLRLEPLPNFREEYPYPPNVTERNFNQEPAREDILDNLYNSVSEIMTREEFDKMANEGAYDSYINQVYNAPEADVEKTYEYLDPSDYDEYDYDEPIAGGYDEYIRGGADDIYDMIDPFAETDESRSYQEWLRNRENLDRERILRVSEADYYNNRVSPYSTPSSTDYTSGSYVPDYASLNQLPPPPDIITIPNSGNLFENTRVSSLVPQIRTSDIESINDMNDFHNIVNSWERQNNITDLPDNFLRDRFTDIFQRYNLNYEAPNLNANIRALSPNDKRSFLRDLAQEIPRRFTNQEYSKMVQRNTRTKNASGLTKEEVLARAPEKDKENISKMTEEEFKETILTPSGEIKPIDKKDYYNNLEVTRVSEKDYENSFNENLDLLNQIIERNKKPNVPTIKVTGLKDGYLTFETPYGESYFYVSVQPGKWQGKVEDINSTNYYKSIPGLEMTNSSASIWGDVAQLKSAGRKQEADALLEQRKGAKIYESINEYLKELGMGRVKAGFNSQTDYSRGAWENFVKSGRGVGHYSDPRTVHAILKKLGGTGPFGKDTIATRLLGGDLKKLPKKKLSKSGTSKNIKSSINKLMARNTDLYGEAGKRFYQPNVKPYYKTGGWLDDM